MKLLACCNKFNSRLRCYLPILVKGRHLTIAAYFSQGFHFLHRAIKFMNNAELSCSQPETLPWFWLPSKKFYTTQHNIKRLPNKPHQFVSRDNQKHNFSVNTALTTTLLSCFWMAQLTKRHNTWTRKQDGSDGQKSSDTRCKQHLQKQLQENNNSCTADTKASSLSQGAHNIITNPVLRACPLSPIYWLVN